MSTQPTQAAANPLALLPTKGSKAMRKNPRCIILFGPSKVGKTTFLGQHPKMLVLDTEGGSEFIDGIMSVRVKGLSEKTWQEQVHDGTNVQTVTFGGLRFWLNTLFQAKQAGNFPYTAIAIDTIDEVVKWIAEAQTVAYNRTANNDQAMVNSIYDLDFGKGHRKVLNVFLDIRDAFLKLGFPFVMIGHRKRRVVGDDNLQVDIKELDIFKALSSQLIYQADAAGYIHRDTENQLKISFMANTEDVSSGTRVPHLAGKIIDADWKQIFV